MTLTLFEPFILTPSKSHEMVFWEKEECYRLYIRERRQNCSFRQIMDLWLHVPYCSSCALSDPIAQRSLPDITVTDWRGDISWKLGDATLLSIDEAIRQNSAYAMICWNCASELRPWEGDEVWIVNYHLEENYGIPLETPGKENPGRRVRRRIIDLYDRACFSCGTTKKELHIDHIIPRSKGGDAAFRNLQPLCTDCGNMKGDDLPDEVDVHLDINFGPGSTDGYEGLF